MRQRLTPPLPQKTMPATKTIAIAKAAKQLAVPEGKLREVIKPFYPENWETIKSLKLTEFDSIAEALKDLAEALDPDFNDENDAFYSGETADLENAAEVGFYCHLPTELESSEPQPSELPQASELPEETNITLAEPADLATQESQGLKVSVIPTFSDFAIDLNKITSALAYSTALKNFANFKEIHSVTFRHHAEQYVGDFDQEYQQMLSDLNDSCDPKAFLKERGITTASTIA